MAIRVRNINGTIIAICAAKSQSKEGDIYLDDSIHHALSTKFTVDFASEGLMTRDVADKELIELMKIEQNGEEF